MGVTLWEKIFINNERKDLSELRKISNAILENETCCQRQNEMAILKRTQKAMTRAMCGVNLIKARLFFAFYVRGGGGVDSTRHFGS